MTMRNEFRSPIGDMHDRLRTGTDCVLNSRLISFVQSKSVAVSDTVPTSTFIFFIQSDLIVNASVFNTKVETNAIINLFMAIKMIY